MESNSYVLVTPARNEEAYIEKTIKSVISQTILPKKWVIVSDGSIDRTDEIVYTYSKIYSFVQLVHIEEQKKRDFGSKVDALNKAYNKLKYIEYEFIGNLDADISLDPYYYESVIKKFQRNAKLGIAGGFIFEKNNGKFKTRPSNSIRSVAGAIQMFRRECYESIGGLSPIEIGGEDWLAEVMARMKGWQVEAFPEIKTFHHRHTGSAGGGSFRRNYREGLKDFSIGSHPLFEVFKCLRRVKEKPYLVGALFRMCGFIWAYCRGEKRVVSSNFLKYIRWEQMHRLKGPFFYIKKLRK
jgi:glycosyltransferase involved in cell wall biosynthesis